MVWTCPTGVVTSPRLLNEDTEASDVMALGREFHSGTWCEGFLKRTDGHFPPSNIIRSTFGSQPKNDHIVHKNDV